MPDIVFVCFNSIHLDHIRKRIVDKYCDNIQSVTQNKVVTKDGLSYHLLEKDFDLAYFLRGWRGIVVDLSNSVPLELVEHYLPF